MQEFVKLTGIVLKTVPIGDYDRRVVILTKERGKISAFAKGQESQTAVWWLRHPLLLSGNLSCMKEGLPITLWKRISGIILRR